MTSHRQLRFSFLLARPEIVSLFILTTYMCLFEETRVPLKSAEFPLSTGVFRPQRASSPFGWKSNYIRLGTLKSKNDSGYMTIVKIRLQDMVL